MKTDILAAIPAFLKQQIKADSAIRRTMRLASLLVPAVLFGLNAELNVCEDWLLLLPSLFLCGNVTILSCPCRAQNTFKPIAYPAVLLLSVAASLLTAPSILPEVLCAVPALELVSGCAIRTVRKYRSTRSLMKSEEVWRAVEDYSRLLYSVSAVILFCFLQSAVGFRRKFPDAVAASVAVVAVSSISGVLYVWLYIGNLTGMSLVLRPSREKEIRMMARGSLRELPSGIDKNDPKSGGLYRKVVNLMEEKKPYLDPDYCLENMARDLYTNHVYLSRTINTYSGRNFRQFLNYYRVQYAMELFKKDMHLKVQTLSVMSGFHTMVSFNMAFKLFLGVSPSEWISRYRLEVRR